ncbi:MAG: tripartite tricarboxylate transporter TctB family protein [Chloroflexota bacterium]
MLSTILFLVSLSFYLGERRRWLTAVISLGVTVALYLGFGEGLHVQLPAGPLGF